MTLLKRCCLSALLTISALSPVLAQSGFTLDTAFAQGGELRYKLWWPRYTWSSNHHYANNQLILPDGKMLLAGRVQHALASGQMSELRYIVTRFHSNGAVDTTYGVKGDVMGQYPGDTGLYASTQEIYHIARQASGKVVISGVNPIGPNAIGKGPLVYRLNPDGTRDWTFGVSGALQVPSQGHLMYQKYRVGHGLFLDSLGRILYMGSDHTGAAQMLRYTADGALDASFGVNGRIPLPYFASSYFQLQDGSLLMAGGGAAGISRFARYWQNGVPAAGFVSTGVAVQGLPYGAQWAGDATLQPDGKILIAGTKGGWGSPYVQNWTSAYVLRLKPNGTIDSTFNSTGIQHFLDSQKSISATAVRFVANKIYIGGSDDEDFLLARLNANGGLDATFGVGGKIIDDYGEYESFRDFIVGNGTLTAVGVTGTCSIWETVVRRYKVPGAVATSVADATVQAIEARIVPNPTRDNITLELVNDALEVSSIAVYDMSGRAVSIRNTQRSTTKHEIVLPHTVPPGHYVLRANFSGGETKSFVFIRQ